jgi:hypothetical protein
MHTETKMKIRPIHPFPARMAPEIAIRELKELASGSVVFDPMVGSGTVVRHAVALGHKATGLDMDPLAVLMSKVWSTPIDSSSLDATMKIVRREFSDLRDYDVYLPWIDDDEETSNFIDFWFGKKQQVELRYLAFILRQLEDQGSKDLQKIVNVLKVALSRIIITKSAGASLAWDVSHSRPHKVMSTSNFEVMLAFERSVSAVAERLSIVPSNARASVRQGDARILTGIKRGTVDLILTSPPYLNAIDYMRGHKLSLVWFGHSIQSLREIRSGSVGAERSIDKGVTEVSKRVHAQMVKGAKLDGRHLSMIERYSVDLVRSIHQASKVLKVGGKAIYVVGNSCLKGAFIKNSDGVIAAAEAAGLICLEARTRRLPNQSRYLPPPKERDTALGKRMRTESVLSFEKVA